jgi:hypothetical protein
MEYSDAEVRCLLEGTVWWMSFHDKNYRSPTISDMRNKLLEDKLKRLHENEVIKLKQEIQELKKELQELKK